MSAYMEQETSFQDADVLCATLKELGITEIQRHESAKHLEGYHGDKRPETAEIIIPRHAVGTASNDIGFKRGADGNYTAIISQFDQSRYNADWMRQLKVRYAENKTIKCAARVGLRFIGKKSVNGKLQSQFIKA